jgi:hypothetical protein
LNAASRNRTPIAASIGLFLIACAVPALVFHTGAKRGSDVWVWEGYRSVSGLALLLTGLFFGWFQANFAAYANLLLWLSWFQYARRSFKAARLTSGMALLLSAETLQLVFKPLDFDEGGVVKGYLTAPQVGFFCWFASMVIILYSSQRVLRAQASARSIA